jgi:hypothetical protein
MGKNPKGAEVALNQNYYHPTALLKANVQDQEEVDDGIPDDNWLVVLEFVLPE